MNYDYKKELDILENQNKNKDHLFWFLIVVLFLFLCVSIYFYQSNTFRQSFSSTKYGVIKETIGYYKSRKPYKCIVTMGNLVVDAACFQNCVIGQQVKVVEVYNAFKVVEYEVLSC